MSAIIQDALLLLKVIDIQDAAVPASEYAVASRSLNRMIQAWSAADLFLWNKQEATVFLQQGQNQYTLGATGNNCTKSYVSTTLTAAAATNATVLAVTSSAGMTALDNVGIVLSTGNIFWTTVSVVNSTTQITLTAGISSGASKGAVVYDYTTGIPARPHLITSARKMDINNLEIVISQVRYEEYFEQPFKTSTGKPILYTYNKQLPNGQLCLWPTPDDMTDVVKISYYEPVEDFSASTDTPDFPKECLDALVYGLAVNLGPMFAIATQDLGVLKSLADEKFNLLKSFNSEEASLLMSPNMRGNARGMR